ncbi:MAG: formylglycine-generating enzyme family protein, partial [Gammaproteobacteria bacterium]
MKRTEICAFTQLITCLVLTVPGASAQTSVAADSALQPGETFKDCRNCPEMIVLPAGSFMLGSPPDEALRRDNEEQKQIAFAHEFAMSRTPVTWDQWEACVRDTWCDGIAVDTALSTLPSGEPNPDYHDYGRGNRPVVGVSWYDAQHFVGWLN